MRPDRCRERNDRCRADIRAMAMIRLSRGLRSVLLLEPADTSLRIEAIGRLNGSSAGSMVLDRLHDCRVGCSGRRVAEGGIDQPPSALGGCQFFCRRSACPARRRTPCPLGDGLIVLMRHCRCARRARLSARRLALRNSTPSSRRGRGAPRRPLPRCCRSASSSRARGSRGGPTGVRRGVPGSC
jgi:hypothetical protein